MTLVPGRSLAHMTSSRRSVPAAWARCTVARHQVDRDVALKVLPQSVAADADRLARFQREAKALAAVDHPNIAQVFGLEGTGSSAAIVMELVDGEDLSAIIAAARCPSLTRLPLRNRSPRPSKPRTSRASSIAT